MNTTTTRRLPAALLAIGLLGAACSGSTPASTPASGSPSATATAQDGGGAASDQVLPVTSNPISNDATADGLIIDNVLVENNEDGSGNAVDDHLEIALSNTTSSDLTSIEVYATYVDTVAGTEESYYTALPSSFTIEAGGTRVAHFDNTGATDHFPVNTFSLYATSVNALDVTVMVSADGVAVQTATVQKDAGGAEVPD